MERRLRDEFGSVLLAIMLAIIVWVNAVYETDSPSDGVIKDVPISILNAPQDLIQISGDDPLVHVHVRAFSSSWGDTASYDPDASLEQGDFVATVDWTDVTTGTNEIPISVTCSDPTVTIRKIDPTNLVVNLDKLARENREVRVELIDQDGVPLGYRVSDPITSPGLVKVIGPSSSVAKVDHLALSISLLNQNATIKRNLIPRPVDAQGNLVEGLTLDPGTVDVTVEIEKQQNYREVAVRARTTGQPARGYFLSGVSVSPSTVTLVGPPAVIDTMGGIVDLIAEIDIAGATRMVADRLELDLPDGVSVVGSQEGEVFEVLVTVGVDAVTGGTTVQLPVTLENVPDGLQAKVSVGVVDVILTGPAVVLDELEIDLLVASVDLAGLTEGTHQLRPQFEVVADADSALRDLVVSGISPEYVEVTLNLPATPTRAPTLRPTPTLVPSPTAAVSTEITGTTGITGTVAADATPSPEDVTPEVTVLPGGRGEVEVTTEPEGATEPEAAATAEPEATATETVE